MLREDAGYFEMDVCEKGKEMQAEPLGTGRSFKSIGIRERVRDFGGVCCVFEAPTRGARVGIGIATRDREGETP